MSRAKKMIKQLLPQEFCLKCRGCCRFAQPDSVWLPCLLDEEIQEFLDNQIPPASISIDKKIQPVPEPGQAGFICPFLNAGDNKCKIYSLRPLECQLYPFLIAVRGKKVILTLDLNCPYIKENLSGKELKDYIEYLTDFLNSQSQVRLLKDNPQIIQAYQDVLDVVELKATDGPGAAGK